MWIKEVVTVGFDPVKEYESIKEFERQNDMRDWFKSESTVCTAYTRNKFVVAEGKENYDRADEGEGNDLSDLRRTDMHL